MALIMKQEHFDGEEISKDSYGYCMFPNICEWDSQGNQCIAVYYDVY